MPAWTIRQTMNQFQPAPPARRATSRFCNQWATPHTFQPAPPARRATVSRALRVRHHVISTRAPRTEGDEPSSSSARLK